MMDFYNGLSSDGVLFFWIIVVLIILLIILLITLFLKNKKLNKLIDNMNNKEKKDNGDSAINNIPIISSEEKEEEKTLEIKEFRPVIKERNSIEELKPRVEEKIELEEKVFAPKTDDKKQEEKLFADKNTNNDKEETGPYKRNVLREMSKKMPISPIGIVKEEPVKREENINFYVEENMISPLEEMEDNYSVNDNMKFASEIVEQMEKEIKPSNIELTDYEKKQEEEAIISYDELLKVKDKIYNITEDEEDDEFIDELKNFRFDLQ